jgi:predicted AlkP superfamily pyrophosphatase or phosphodiesterase
MMKTTALALLGLTLVGCAYPYTPPVLAPITAPAPTTMAVAAMPGEVRAPVTILVSIDGFRPDYLDRDVTPNLNRLRAGGVFASMRPSFPSVTFPNHWTLVTGLRPDRSGIVGNKMEDPARPGETFTMATDDPFWWSGSSPIWVDAEKAGIRTATMFWPGANVAIGGTIKPNSHGAIDGGTRPEDWQQFNQQVSGTQRVNAVIDWMRRPAAIRPKLVTLYFDAVDSAGHAGGPDSEGVTRAAADVDASIGLLVDGLAALGQPANLVIVADHGMAATSSERVVALDTIANPADYRVIEAGSYATLFATPGHEAALEARLLTKHDHLQCWRKSEIPARFHYGRNPRVPSYLCLADVGWRVDPSAPTKASTGGSHGYDNMAPEMRALFIANGPAFAGGKTIASFDNVDVEPLLRDLIGLPAEAGLDGSDAPFQKVMQR